MTILLILNHAPYDGTDLTWNALRLAGQLKQDGAEVRLFLMNDSVDLARDGVPVPEGSSDLAQMTKDLIATGVTVKVCAPAWHAAASARASRTTRVLRSLRWPSYRSGFETASRC
jgi:sulfur relay (sulfurtransferase) complex TusBCD TusD component (DsrE family)